MPYGATAADASRPSTPTAGIDDTVDQPAPFDRPPASSPPSWLPLLAAPPQAQATPQGSTPSAPAQLSATPRRPQGTYWSLLSPSGALLPVTNPMYQQPRAIDDIKPTPAPVPPPDVRQQTGTQAWPGEQAQSNYWQATHGVDTAPTTTPADNSPWATLDWQHTPVLGRILEMGEAFGNGFRAGQVPRAASPQATYRAAQAGDESYMPSFLQTGPSLRDVVTGIPSALADTARMATTPPPLLPEGAYMRDDGAVQGTADPQAWRAWVTEMQRRAELGPSLAMQMLGVGTFAKLGAPSLVTAPPLVPERVSELMPPPRLPNRPATPFAPPPADLPDVDLAALEARAQEIHAVLDPSWAKPRRTTAVLSTNEKTIVGGGAKHDLEDEQLDLLRDGEVPAKLPGAHAEITVLWKALARGYTPRALATSRPICPDCWPIIEAFGGKKISPTLAIFPIH
jgi:hypothetical protein